MVAQASVPVVTASINPPAFGRDAESLPRIHFGCLP